MDAILLYLIQQYPVLSSIVMTIGSLRLVMKPVVSAVLTYVENSPSVKDNEFIEKVKKNKYWKAAFWVLDYVSSVKLPSKK